MIADSHEKHRHEFVEMLDEFEAMRDGTVIRITTSRHGAELNSDNVRPVRSAPYRAEPAAEQLDAIEIARMLKEDIIELEIFEWASSIVFTPKKDRSLHFCVSYLKLNSVTIRDSHPFPRMDEIID